MSESYTFGETVVIPPDSVPATRPGERLLIRLPSKEIATIEDVAAVRVMLCEAGTWHWRHEGVTVREGQLHVKPSPFVGSR